MPQLDNAFRRLALANLTAQAAEQIALAAAPIFAVLTLGAGPGDTALLTGAQTLPFLLLSLPAGLLVDRFSRRRLMLGAEILRALVLAALPVLFWAHLMSLPGLAIAGALVATGTVVFSVAAPALVTTLVARSQFIAANRTLELARSLAFAAGPALGGALVSLSGAALAFGCAAALSLASAGWLSRLAEPDHDPAPRRRLLADITEGVRFVAGHQLLRPIILTAVAWNTSWFILQAVFVAYAAQRLHMSAVLLGITLGAYGAGMVAGALVASRIARHLRFGMLIACGPLISVPAAACIVATTVLHETSLPILAFFLFGFGPILWTIGQTTLRQAVTPDAMLGRISALSMMATTGARPLGAAIGGVVAMTIGMEAAMILAGAGFVLQAMIILASPVARLGALPTHTPAAMV